MPDLTKREQSAIARIKKRGGVVLVHHGDRGGHCYVTADGREVGVGTFLRLRRLGVLTPNNDGLFAATPQTYRIASSFDG